MEGLSENERLIVDLLKEHNECTSDLMLEALAEHMEQDILFKTLARLQDRDIITYNVNRVGGIPKRMYKPMEQA